jgi:hypothetical protein
MPFIKDVNTVVSGLKKKVGRQRVTTRASASDSRVERLSLASGSSPGNVVLYDKQSVEKVTIRAMSLDEYVVTAADNIGLATKGLITLPWELIPYSFVADWFVNFGDFLQALVPLPGVKQLGSCVVTERDRQTSYTATGSIPASGWTLIRPVTGQFLTRYLTRTRTALSDASIVIKSDFKFDEATRLADATALITQRMGRLFT